MWQLKWSQESENYIYGNAPYTVLLFNELVSLAATDDGLPTYGAHNLGEGFIMGTVADHTVVWELRNADKIFIVWAIKPAPTSW